MRSLLSVTGRLFQLSRILRDAHLEMLFSILGWGARFETDTADDIDSMIEINVRSQRSMAFQEKLTTNVHSYWV